MKPARVLLIGIVALAVLLLAAAGLAFTSGFQTWAVRRALAGRPGLDVSLGRISAGLGLVRVENVRVTRSGAVLTLPMAEAELPLLSAAVRQQVLIRRLTARGWTLDLTRAQPAAAAAPLSAHREFSLLPSAYADAVSVAAPAVFSGIFSQLSIPVDLTLDGVVLAGDVLLPALPGHPAARASVTITGGGLAAGHPGQFDYTASIVFAGEDIAVSELKIRGTLGVVMGTPRTFTRFVASTEAEATGQKFPDGVRLAVDVSAAQSAAGESYALAVLSGTKQLAAIETSFAAGQSHLRGTWRIDMHDTDLAPFVLGRELPAFAAAGDGWFDLDATLTELNASGRLKATADRLAAVTPGLGVLGHVQLVADFDVTRRGQATRVDRLAVSITGAKPIATVQALQAFEFNLKTGELNVADPAKELLAIAFQGLPLAWAAPLLGAQGYALTGNELRGEFVASARNGGFALRPRGPLTIGNLSVAGEGGRPLLRAVDITLAASADYSPLGWQVELAPLAVGSNGASLFTLEAKAGQLSGKDQPVKTAGKWTAQLPALLGQPVFSRVAALTGGEARGDFAASLGAKREVQARLVLTKLSTAAAPSLPAVTAELRADLVGDGSATFNVPMRFEQSGRISDLTFAGTFVPSAAGAAINSRLTSERLMIDDVLPFLLALATPAEPAGSAAGGSAGHSAASFWDGLSGGCTLAVKQVAYGGQFQVTDLSGALRLEPEAFKLADVRAAFGPDSTMRLNGGITFTPAAPQPYALAADFVLENFDVAPLLRALNPGRPATVEGRFNLQSRLTGAGATLADLPDHTRGELRASSKGGVFRALSADLSDRIQKTQSTVTTIASLLGVVADDYVNKTKIISDIAKSLAEIPFDQLSLTASRDASHNLQLKDFTLISPELRLGGSGVIRYAAGVPVLAQPLELSLNLGARGRMADLMKRAGLLDAQQDNLGYAAFSVPLRLGGTLAKVDTGKVRDALLNSALERSGLLDNLFNRGK